MKTRIFLSLHLILLSAWRRRYLIAMPIVLIPVLALAVGLYAPKKYISHTTVLIQETSTLNPFLADLSVSSQLQERMAALTALLHSRHMLGAVAKDLGWIDQPSSAQTENEIRRLSDALSVQLIGTDMVRLNYTDDQPERMEQVLKVVSQHFLTSLLAPERSSMDASEGFLQTQLTLQREALLEAEKRLAAFKGKNSANLPDQYNFDVEQLREAETELREKKTALVGARASLGSLNTQLAKTNPMMAKIELAIVEKTTELSQLSTRYTEQHSAVIAAQKALERLQTERQGLLEQTEQLKNMSSETLWLLASSMPAAGKDDSFRPLLVSQMEAVESAKSRQQQLEEEVTQLEQVVLDLRSKIEAFAGIELSLKELERDIATRKSVYDDFLKRYEMAKVTGALGRYEERDRVKVIDQPFTPMTPANPPLLVYVLAGVVGGLLLGIVLAVLAEVTNSTIIRRDVVEQLLGVPVLTRIPRLQVKA